MTEGTLRTFVGVPLEGDLVATMERLIERMRRSIRRDSAVKWERRSNMHVTLHFLGNTPRASLDGIEAALVEAARAQGPFQLSLGAPDWFPGRGKPRVLIVPIVDGHEELRRLQRAVAVALEPLGFPPDRREFRPHATIGRVRRRQKLTATEANALCEAQAQTTAGVSMPVGGLRLIESQLTPQGAIYSPLETFLL